MPRPASYPRGMTHPNPTATLVPVLVCAFAVMLLTVMDAGMKSLVLAVGVYNTVLWRSMLASVVAGSAWLAGRPSMPAGRVLRLHALRALVVCATVLLFFSGLAHLPIAEAIALSFIAPLIALILAALLLGERIGRTAILASLTGLAGVAIIMAGQMGQASYGADALFGSGAVLASAFTYAYNLILARQQALVARPLEVSFFQNLFMGVLLALVSFWLANELPREFWPMLAAVTALSLTGQFLLSWAYGRAEAQYLIPIEYTAFVLAVLFGWFFFGDEIGWTTFAGAALIVAGCLYAAMRKPKLAEPIEVAAV